MSEVPVNVRDESTITADRIPDEFYARLIVEGEEQSEASSPTSSQNEPEIV